jgi:hypothetical protein
MKILGVRARDKELPYPKSTVSKYFAAAAFQ